MEADLSTLGTGKFDMTIKIIIIGDVGTGKTTLL